MKRPVLLTVALTVVAAVIAAFADSALLVIVGVVCFAGFVFSLIKHKLPLAAALFICIILFCNVYFILSPKIDVSKRYVDENCTVEGIVSKRPQEKDGYTEIIVLAQKIDGTKVPFATDIRLICQNPTPCMQGNKVIFTADLSYINNSNHKLGNYSDNIFLTGKNIVVKRCEKDNNIYAFSGAIKQYVCKTVNNVLPQDAAAVTTNLMIGDKSSLSDTFADNVKSAGVSHIMVVSGMHLGIICVLFMKLFGKFLSQKATASATLVCVFTVMAVCDFSFSVLRAGVVYIIFLLGIILRREGDPLSSFCVAVTLILVVNPFALFNISFLLSITATFGILVAAPYVKDKIILKIKNEKLTKHISPLITVVTQTLNAALFTLPVSVYSFGRVSLVTLFTNLVVSYVMTVCLWAAVIGVILTAVGFVKLAALMFAAVSICTKVFIAVVNFFSNLPYATVPVINDYAFVIALFILSLAAVFVLHRKAILKKGAKQCALILTVIFVFVTVFVNHGKYYATAIYAQNEQCVIIAEDGNAVLIGAGKKSTDSDKINSALKLYRVKRIKAIYLLGENCAVGAATHLNIKADSIYFTDNNLKTRLTGYFGNIDVPPEKASCGSIKISVAKSGCVTAKLGGNSIFVASKSKPDADDKLNSRNAQIMFCPADAAKYYKGARINIISSGENAKYKLCGETYETVTGKSSFIIK